MVSLADGSSEVARVQDQAAAKPRRRSISMPALKRLGPGAGLVLVGALLGTGYVNFREARPVITVNGTGISRREFLHRCELAAGPAVAREMAKEELQLQFARQQGVYPDDAQVEKRYSEMEKQPDFQKSLVASGKSTEDLKKGIRLDLIQTGLVDKGMDASETDALAFYKSNTDPANLSARYFQPEQIQIAIIASDKTQDIQDALHALASGASFAAVATKYSKDASKAKNGLLPPVRRGQLDAKKFPGLEEKLFEMKPGQQLDSVDVAGAKWIIRCVAHTQQASIPYEKVKAECLEGAKLVKGLQANGKSLQSASETFQKSASVQFLDPRYRP